MAKSKEEVIHAIKRSLRKTHKNWSEDKVLEVAHKIYNARSKAKKEKELMMKEGDDGFRVFGFIRSTVPDMDGDVSPLATLEHWADQINGGFQEATKGDVHHDRDDLHLTSVAEYAEVLPLPDMQGHHGLWVADFVNEKHPDFETTKYEIEHSLLPAYSVEYDRTHETSDGRYTIITPKCDLWGYAHASRPVDLHALKTSFKENGYNYARFILTGVGKDKADIKIKSDSNSKTKFEDLNKLDNEVNTMEEKLKKKEDGKEELKEGEKQGEEVKDDNSDESKKEEESVEDKIEEKEQKSQELNVKEELEKLNLKMKELVDKEQVEKKPLVKSKEIEEKEMNENVSLNFKEMKDAVGKRDWMAFKEAGMNWLEEPDVDLRFKEQFESDGIKLKTTMKFKCKGTKIEIVSGPKWMGMKNILVTDSNPGAYTESGVEFADIFQPGLINTFNEQQGLFGEMLKVDNIGGAPLYGFTIQTTRNTSGGAVDPNNVTVETGFVEKLKCRQEIKVYRFGVSVADYTLYHSRASLGQLFQLEVDKAMEAWVHTVATDLYREGVGTEGGDSNKILGLEAVADSAGNTTLYGKTRSSSNRLSPGTAANTYLLNNGSIVEAELRSGMEQMWKEGSRTEDVRLVMNPTTRSYLFNLMDTSIRFNSINRTATATLGFDRFLRPSFDGIPIIVDHRCTSTAGDPIYVIDIGPEGWVMVVSKPPQLTGLAKVSAAQSAYVEGYITTVYKRPRNIYMYDQNTGPTS